MSIQITVLNQLKGLIERRIEDVELAEKEARVWALRVQLEQLSPHLAKDIGIVQDGFRLEGTKEVRIASSPPGH